MRNVTYKVTVPFLKGEYSLKLCERVVWHSSPLNMLKSEAVLTPHDRSVLRKELIEGSCAPTVKIVRRSGIIVQKGKAESD